MGLSRKQSARDSYTVRYHHLLPLEQKHTVDLRECVQAGGVEDWEEVLMVVQSPSPKGTRTPVSCLYSIRVSCRHIEGLLLECQTVINLFV